MIKEAKEAALISENKKTNSRVVAVLETAPDAISE
jgi:hypothetical protein